MDQTTTLYGEVTSEMDDFDKIRERVRARLIKMGWDATLALEAGGDVALTLESDGVTDDQLLQAEAASFSGIVSKAYGQPDRDISTTLKEAYGKIAA